MISKLKFFTSADSIVKNFLISSLVAYSTCDLSLSGSHVTAAEVWTEPAATKA